MDQCGGKRQTDDQRPTTSDRSASAIQAPRQVPGHVAHAALKRAQAANLSLLLLARAHHHQRPRGRPADHDRRHGPAPVARVAHGRQLPVGQLVSRKEYFENFVTDFAGGVARSAKTQDPGFIAEYKATLLKSFGPAVLVERLMAGGISRLGAERMVAIKRGLAEPGRARTHMQSRR